MIVIDRNDYILRPEFCYIVSFLAIDSDNGAIRLQVSEALLNEHIELAENEFRCVKLFDAVEMCL